MDGFTSSAVLYNYLRQNYIDYNFELSYHIPEGKEHGLEVLMPLLQKEKICDLIICPDSSSNDEEFHKILSEMGYEILVIDHHLASGYSPYATVINNQLSEKYQNKELSGVGVVYKLLQLLDERNDIRDADNYLDLVAAGICADMCPLLTLENRFISEYGFSHLNNMGLRELIKYQAYSILGVAASEKTDWDKVKVNPIDISFYIAPLVNALIRVGTIKDKETLFEAFINGRKLVDSTKRGHKGELESIAEQNARNCANARARQNKEKEKATELLDIQIFNDNLDENKILILNADELETPNTLTGLCAMNVAAKYKKPILLGRTTPDGQYLKGSMRGQNGSELKDFRKFLLDSGYMDYVEGHANASGFSLKISDIPKLYDYANKQLANINFNEGFYEVDFIVDNNCPYLKDLIFELDKGKSIYGQDCDEPLIVVENISVAPASISFIGTNKDTLKISSGDITFIKFKAKELIEQLQDLLKSLKATDKISFTIIGKGNINTWCGRKTPQIFIEGLEFEKVNKYTF
jgi:single-stranded-DNA-specific exonuclease